MLIHGIDTKDISVVVQGAITPVVTELCLSSIRKYLPEAEIILSTWKGSTVEGLDYDQLILNDDPGCFDLLNIKNSPKCNINRQLYSTIQGLRKANRKYAVKIRTDFVLEAAGFLYWFQYYPNTNKKFTFFKQKLICCELFSRNPRFLEREVRYVLHPSDFFFFGLREDLIDLFDIPLISFDDSIYLARKCYGSVVLNRYTPEQFLWIGFLRKHLSDISILPESQEEFSFEHVKLTEQTFAANFIILSFEQCGIKCTKVQSVANYTDNCFTHRQWKWLYNYYCKHKIIYYILYYIEFFLVNKKDLIFRKTSSQQKVRDCIRRFVAKCRNVMTPQEKEFLKPAYVMLRSIYYRFLSCRNEKGNYVACYFNEKVSDNNLSVVIQGPITSATRRCLESVRQTLPHAEIILSTWEGSDIAGLDFDQCQFSKDPGSNGLIRKYPQPQIHNVNRLLVSSLKGVKAATRRYCLKIRSDMEITSNDFLYYYNKYSSFIGKKAIVSRRIMAEGVATDKYISYSVSDWWYLGLKQDLVELFNSTMYGNDDICYYNELSGKNTRGKFCEISCRYIPEEYIIYQYIKRKAPKGDYDQYAKNDFYDNSPQNLNYYHKFLAENFVLIEFSKSGIVLPKAERRMAFLSSYTESDFLKLCKQYGTLPSNLIDKRAIVETEALKKKANLVLPFEIIRNNCVVISDYAKFPHRQLIENIDRTIDKRDITFVVAGRNERNGEFTSYRCLESIRRFFPQSQILLCFWEKEEDKDLYKFCDDVLILQKPVAEPVNIFKKSSGVFKQNSINLQQYSINKLLQRVKTKYAVRLRSDFYLQSDDFLNFYIKWSNVMNMRDLDYSVFNSRILVTRNFIKDPRQNDGAYSYYLSDTFQFGLTADLMTLWDGHQESLDTLTFFDEHPDCKWANPEGFNHRYTAEQYFLLNVLKKAKLNLKYPKYYFDKSSDIYAFESEKIYASNILVGDNLQLGLGNKFADSNYPTNYTLELLLEKYLYNVDPDNVQCLNYLRQFYTTQRQDAHYVKAIALLRIQQRCITAVWSRFRKIANKMMRNFLPSYRIACSVSDMQKKMEQEQVDRFNYLVSRINIIEKRQCEDRKVHRREDEEDL